MKKEDLLKQMVKKGMEKSFCELFLDGYLEIDPFSYVKVKNDTGHKYKKYFGKSYDKFGIYIFYDPKNGKIKYIGEAASEPFSKRLTQHFNESNGGLRFKKADKIDVIEACDVLILYGKHDNNKYRDIHFDEDLLIGLFRPFLNDR